MLGAILLRVEIGDRPLTTPADLTNNMLRPISLSEARHLLLPLLPPGTEWAEGESEGLWRSEVEANELRVITEGAVISSVLVKTRAFDGSVLAALRRIQDSHQWQIMSMQKPQSFNFAQPDEN